MREQRPAAARPAPPRRPRWPVPLALLGLLGLALAAILAWGVNPGRKQLPADLDTTRQYTGLANSLFDPQALQNGDFNSAIITNVPVTGERTVQVLDADGNNARVLDERTLFSGNTQIATTSATYAVDRTSMEPATDVPASWNVQPHQGLTVAFPAGAEQQDYQGWVSDTQTTTTLRFVREEQRGGVNTFVYLGDTTSAPIRDQSVLSQLPTSISRAQLQGLSPSLALTAEQQAALTQALPGLPDQIPLNYTYQGATTYWVEPTSGIVVDSTTQAIRNGAITGPGGATLANLPVYNVDQRFTDDAVAAAGNEALDRRNSLESGGRVWPWILGILGAIALLVGLLGLLMRRRPEPVPATARPTHRPTERTDTEATRRTRGSQPGQPQAPYSGQSRHTGPYRESAGPPPPNEEEFPTREQPGQYPGGMNPPPGNR